MASSVYPYATNMYYKMVAIEEGTNSATNTSQVRIRCYIGCSSGWGETYGIGGQPGNWSRGYTYLSAGQEIEVYTSGLFDVGHNLNGSGSYSFSGASGASGWGEMAYFTESITLTDFNRTPDNPAKPTLTRNGTIIEMSSSTTIKNGGPKVDRWDWYYGTTSDAPTPLNFRDISGSPSNSDSWIWTAPSKTQPYYIKVYAHNADDTNNNGWSGASEIAYIAGTPSKPSAPTLVRNTNNGSTITPSWSAPVNNGATITNYRISIREGTGGSWTSYTTTNLSYPFNSLTNTSTYYFKVEAYNSSGWSDISDESSIVGVPTQPSSITVPTPVGLATTVSWGTSTNGTISNYYVSASPDNGVTWQAEIAKGTNTSHLFTGLNGGKTYKFRVRAQNQIGYSTYVVSESKFVPAGGRRWTGSAWTPTETARRWDGSSWVQITIAKRWDPSANSGAGGWVNLS